MKLSEKSIDILKNFATINNGMLFKRGKVVKTVSPQKNVLAIANIEDEIPHEFAIYDLNNFLSLISITSDNQYEFDDTFVTITGKDGRSKLKYRVTDPKMIVVPPESEINFPDPETSIEISSEDINWVFKIASVLGTPIISIISDGKKVYMSSFDAKGGRTNQNELFICDGNGDVYNYSFKIDHLKVFSGNYLVSLSSRGVSNWKNTSTDVEYWITIEPGSTFQKG